MDDLPPSLFHNTQLQQFDLTSVKIDSTIPSISTATALTDLGLKECLLRGSLPDPLPSGIFQLDLSFNVLSGTIPPSYAKLTKFTHLDLSYNNLEQVVPSSLFTCSLESLILDGNYLDCPQDGPEPTIPYW